MRPGRPGHVGVAGTAPSVIDTGPSTLLAPAGGTVAAPLPGKGRVIVVAQLVDGSRQVVLDDA